MRQRCIGAYRAVFNMSRRISGMTVLSATYMQLCLTGAVHQEQKQKHLRPSQNTSERAPGMLLRSECYTRLQLRKSIRQEREHTTTSGRFGLRIQVLQVCTTPELRVIFASPHKRQKAHTQIPGQPDARCPEKHLAC